jgi:four helix bundle protein
MARCGAEGFDDVLRHAVAHIGGVQDFRRLLVWRRAHAFAVSVRRAVELFPRRGYSELKSQLIRAAESIGNNIVEGCGAATRKEFARYLDISAKSTSEVDHQLELARDYGVLAYRVWKPLSIDIVEIRKMLHGLRRAVLAADQGERRGSSRASQPDDLDATANRADDEILGRLADRGAFHRRDWKLTTRTDD